MGICLYDPVANMRTKTSYSKIEKLYGYSSSNISRAKRNLKKLKRINCYVIDECMSKKFTNELYRAEKIDMEIWKDIVGYEGYYEVSDHGRVRRKGHGLLIPTFSNSSAWVVLHVGERKYKYINNLVYEAFIGEKKEGYVIHHKDCCFYNNRLENLTMITRNESNAINNSIKLSQPIIKKDLDGNIIDFYESKRIAAEENYTSINYLNKILKRKDKVGLGYMWDYDKESFKFT